MIRATCRERCLACKRERIKLPYRSIIGAQVMKIIYGALCDYENELITDALFLGDDYC